jgi:hypothetical protein
MSHCARVRSKSAAAAFLVALLNRATISRCETVCNRS